MMDDLRKGCAKSWCRPITTKQRRYFLLKMLTACQTTPAYVLSFLVGEILTHVSDRITDAACRTFSPDFETV